MYQQNKNWSDKFMPEIKARLAAWLHTNWVVDATELEDCKIATDLVVLTADSVRIACRIRRHRYLENCGSEFTLRLSQSSGMRTELEKILRGWGDYLFYGFSDEHEVGLARYFIGDLSVFRRWFVQERAARQRLPGRVLTNTDRRTQLIAFALQDLPPEFVVASSWSGKTPKAPKGPSMARQPDAQVLLRQSADDVEVIDWPLVKRH